MPNEEDKKPVELAVPGAPVAKTDVAKPAPPSEAAPVPPVPPVSKPAEAVPSAPTALGKVKLTREEREKLLARRRRASQIAGQLKKAALLLVVASVGFFLWLKADLDSENRFLSVFGLPQNVGIQHKSLLSQHRVLAEEESKIKSQIGRLRHQLETGQYSIYTPEINDIRSQQLIWFDQKKPDGGVNFGLLDSVGRMQNYFNNRSYTDPKRIIVGNSRINIENIAVDRSGATFTAEGSNLFGKIFFLNTEFVEMMNAFPFFKNGVVRSFTRKKNEIGEDAMTFSVKLEMQQLGENDPADIRFNEYLQWLEGSSSEGPRVKE